MFQAMHIRQQNLEPLLLMAGLFGQDLGHLYHEFPHYIEEQYCVVGLMENDRPIHFTVISEAELLEFWRWIEPPSPDKFKQIRIK